MLKFLLMCQEVSNFYRKQAKIQNIKKKLSDGFIAILRPILSNGVHVEILFAPWLRVITGA